VHIRREWWQWLESDHCIPKKTDKRKHQARERERERKDVACTALRRKGMVRHG
jgi:hypothetical protein